MEMNLIKPTINLGYARNALESACPNLWNGKVGHWVPALGPQGDKLYDVSGYGNHGDLTNMTNDDWVPGRDGYALDFDGVNDYVDLNFVQGTYPGLSVFLWMKVKSHSTDNEYVIDNSVTNGFFLRMRSGGFYATAVYTSTGVSFIGVWGSITDGEWSFVGLTYDGATQRVYQDAIEQATNSSGSGSLAAETTSTILGAVYAGTLNVDIQVADVRIYNRALSPSEIRLLYRDPFADLRLRDFAFGRVQGGTIYNKSLTDGLKLGDSSINSLNRLGNITDGLKLGDSSINSLNRLGNITDGLKLGDSVVNIASLFSALTDGIILGEGGGITSLVQVVSTLTDGIALGDSGISVVTKEESVSDGVIFGDSVINLSDLFSTMADGVSLGDASSVVGTYNNIIADGVVFGDSILSALSGTVYNMSVTDGVLYGDSTTNLAVFLASTKDGITLSDSHSTQAVYEISITDGITIGELITALNVKEGVVSDGIMLSDSVSNLATLISVITDSIVVGDSNTTTTNIFNVAISDGITLGDVVNFSGGNITGLTVTIMSKGASLNFTIKKPETTFTKKT